jgi:hypothetical protein
VNEESEASFDQVKIENTRSVSGTGDINAAQMYSGSGGYKGSAILSAQGASGTLHGNAFLTPEYLRAWNLMHSQQEISSLEALMEISMRAGGLESTLPP